jgi:hypothetical protein
MGRYELLTTFAAEVGPRGISFLYADPPTF